MNRSSDCAMVCSAWLPFSLTTLPTEALMNCSGTLFCGAQQMRSGRNLNARMHAAHLHELDGGDDGWSQ